MRFHKFLKTISVSVTCLEGTFSVEYYFCNKGSVHHTETFAARFQNYFREMSRTYIKWFYIRAFSRFLLPSFMLYLSIHFRFLTSRLSTGATKVAYIKGSHAFSRFFLLFLILKLYIRFSYLKTAPSRLSTGARFLKWEQQACLHYFRALFKPISVPVTCREGSVSIEYWCTGATKVAYIKGSHAFSRFSNYFRF